MIPGGRCNYPTLLLLGRQLRQSIARPAFFEASGALQVVQFAINLHAGDLAQRNGGRAGRIKDRAFNAAARRFDVIERDHFRFNILWANQQQYFDEETNVGGTLVSPMAALPPSPKATARPGRAALTFFA